MARSGPVRAAVCSRERRSLADAKVMRTDTTTRLLVAGVDGDAGLQIVKQLLSRCAHAFWAAEWK